MSHWYPAGEKIYFGYGFRVLVDGLLAHSFRAVVRQNIMREHLIEQSFSLYGNKETQREKKGLES
jgi:hypothetical protein